MVREFWVVEEAAIGLYRVLAVSLVVLLMVPVSTLAASAARLSARRRDDQLATLSLLGAQARWVRLVAVAESTLLAAVGLLAGVIVHLLLAPLLVFFLVAGRTLPIGEVFLPWGVIAWAWWASH